MLVCFHPKGSASTMSHPHVQRKTTSKKQGRIQARKEESQTIHVWNSYIHLHHPNDPNVGHSSSPIDSIDRCFGKEPDVSRVATVRLPLSARFPVRPSGQGATTAPPPRSRPTLSGSGLAPRIGAAIRLFNSFLLLLVRHLLLEAMHLFLVASLLLHQNQTNPKEVKH